MQYLIRRLRSYFFWGLCLWLAYWYSAQPQVIAEQLRRDSIQIAEAKSNIANGYYDAVTVCNDGWVSDSIGKGTCSWHRGVNENYYREKATAHLISNRDINDLRKRYQSSAKRKLAFRAVLIFLFSPLLDLLILRRGSLYSTSSADLPPTPSKPDIRPPLPPNELSKPPQNGLPPCPLCGAEMRIRRALRGKNRGKQFLGCSTYPRCRGTRPFPSGEA
ncbi:topoisomerase DNA-binding C4 zinc finger domain-containing protein [Vulcaniibacterium thermophilum]